MDTGPALVRGLIFRKFIVDPTWTPEQLRVALRRESRRQLAMQPAWAGRVFLNSPLMTHRFGQRAWRTKWQAEPQTEAIQLCNSNLGYVWYEACGDVALCVCGRTHSFRARRWHLQGAASKQGQTFAYYGPRPDVLRAYFARLVVSCDPRTPPNAPDVCRAATRQRWTPARMCGATRRRVPRQREEQAQRAVFARIAAVCASNPAGYVDLYYTHHSPNERRAPYAGCAMPRWGAVQDIPIL